MFPIHNFSLSHLTFIGKPVKSKCPYILYLSVFLTCPFEFYIDKDIFKVKFLLKKRE